MRFLDTLAQIVSGIHPDIQGPTYNLKDQPIYDPREAQSVGEGAPVVTDPNQILVNGRNQQSQQQDAPAPNFGNTDYIREADAANQNAEDAAQHHGKFGVKGTLRDVLGLIGDAFLVQSGNKSTYDVKRQQERENDSMTGFTNDPLAAMERLSRNNAPGAQKMYDDYQKNMNQYAATQSLEKSRESQAANRTADNIPVARAQLMRIINQGKTPEQRARLGQTYAPLLAKQAGVDITDLGYDPSMSDEDLQAFAGGDMTVNQQTQVPFTERKVTASETNARAHMINATRPRSGGATHSTDLEHYQSINQPGHEKTDADVAWEKKYLHGTHPSFLDNLGVPPPTNAPARQKGWTVKRN